MKNASLPIIFCILLSFFMFLTYPFPEREEENAKIKVYDSESKKVFEMELEEYVWRALANEMPALFHIEALKAQAVAIRSYTLSKSPSDVHKGAVVCTDYKHCAAYLKDEKSIDEKYIKLYKKAVNDTKGEILLYDNKPINAVFHAMSSGKTENASDVWGKSVPYLVSVDSVSDKSEEGFETIVSFNAGVLQKKLGVASSDIGEIVRSEAGGVKTIEIGGKSFKGSEIRNLLNLRSCAFKAENNQGTISFTVHGYGHGVGMSQRGANACAQAGLGYREILLKYYKGVSLAKV